MKRILSLMLLTVMLLVGTTNYNLFAQVNKYEPILEKMILKKSGVKQEALITKLETLLPLFEKKIQAKVDTSTGVKKEKYEKKLVLVRELMAALQAVVIKLEEKKNIIPEIKMEELETEIIVDTPMTMNGANNTNGKFYLSKYTKEYQKGSDQRELLQEGREAYIKAALDKGYSQKDAIDAADIFVGVTIAEQFYTAKFNIDHKNKITGQWCQPEQKWKDGLIRDGIEEKCKDKIGVRDIAYIYDKEVSNAIGYPVYVDYANRYLIDYKKGFIISAYFGGTYKLQAQSEYKEIDLFSTKKSDALESMDIYTKLVTQWSETANKVLHK